MEAKANGDTKTPWDSWGYMGFAVYIYIYVYDTVYVMYAIVHFFCV